MWEVVEFRDCSGCCGDEDCKDEKETVLFQHEDKPVCINFMKLRAYEKGTKDILVKSEEEVSYRFYFGKLVGQVNLRTQKC